MATGTYTAKVTATATGYTTAETTVTFTVTAAPSSGRQVVISATADRANPQPLDGRTVRGNIFVFTTPDTGVRQVRYFIDRVKANGRADRTDTAAPFDLRGGTTATAEPFDTRTLSPGRHTITAAFDLTSGGTQLVTATITVDQNAP
jgi:hypothetical protein